MKPILVALGLMLVASVTVEARTACGGEGPQPFITVTGPKLGFSKIATQGPVQDFVLNPRDGLLYRNLMGWASYFLNGVSYPMEYLPHRLTPITDSKGRYHLAFDSGATSATLLDMRLRRSFQIPAPAGAKPLYWGGGALHWVRERTNAEGHGVIETFYQYPHRRPVHHCTVQWKTSRPYKLATGSFFPHVFLYHTVPLGSGEQLSFYDLNTSTCAVSSVGTYKEPTSGPVEFVHYFREPGGWAVKVDHAQNSLLWDNGTECHYFNLGSQPMIPVESSEAVMATWSGRDGLQFWSLDTQLKMAILPPGFDPLESSDIALLPKTGDLFIRATPSGTRDPRILHTDLTPLMQ